MENASLKKQTTLSVKQTQKYATFNYTDNKKGNETEAYA